MTPLLSIITYTRHLALPCRFPLPADIPVLKSSLSPEVKPPGGRAGDRGQLPAHVTLYLRFARMWKVIADASTHPLARRETIRFTVLTAMFLPVHVDEDDHPTPGGFGGGNGGVNGWDNGWGYGGGNGQNDPSPRHPQNTPSRATAEGSKNVDLKAALGLLTEELRYQCGQGLLADVRVLQLCLVGIRVVMEKDAALLLDDGIQTDVALFAGRGLSQAP